MKKVINFFKYIYYGLKEELTGSVIHKALTMPADEVIGRVLLKAIDITKFLFLSVVSVIITILIIILEGGLGLIMLTIGIGHPIISFVIVSINITLAMIALLIPDQFIDLLYSIKGKIVRKY